MLFSFHYFYGTIRLPLLSINELFKILHTCSSEMSTITIYGELKYPRTYPFTQNGFLSIVNVDIATNLNTLTENTISPGDISHYNSRSWNLDNNETISGDCLIHLKDC